MAVLCTYMIHVVFAIRQTTLTHKNHIQTVQLCQREDKTSMQHLI